MEAYSWTDSPHISELLRLFCDPPCLPGLRQEEALFQRLIALEEEAARADVPEATRKLIANVRRTAGKAALALGPPVAECLRGD
jgi:hypothetical protein